MKIKKVFIGLILIISFIWIHELGHLFGALLTGGIPHGFGFFSHGIGMSVECHTGICVLVTAISGPLLSLIFTIPVYIVGYKKIAPELYIPSGALMVTEIMFFWFSQDGSIVIQILQFDATIISFSFFFVGLSLYIIFLFTTIRQIIRYEKEKKHYMVFK